MTERPTPYPAETKAKGWRFELDIEQIMQSDTWALAPAEVRPWLLMLWTVAWQQVPCGSMPADDALIVARLGMPPKLFAKHRAVLLRGWWPAEDDRLYHDTIAVRVRAMLTSKEAERKRKADYRARMAAEAEGRSGSPDLSHGTDAGQQRDSGGIDATGTRTRTGLSKEETHTSLAAAQRVLDGEVSLASQATIRMRAAGIASVSPQHPELLALLAAGVTPEQFGDAATQAVSKGKGFPYALGIVRGWLREANAVTETGLAMPQKPWDESRSTIEAEGERVGVGRWSESDFQAGRGESFAAYTARVRRARGDAAEVPA